MNLMLELFLDIFYWLSFFLFVFVFTGVAVRLIMLVLSIAWIIYEKKILSAEIAPLPRISMLIPAFNEAETIVESVTHAVNQTYPDLEIIIVNDGSTDNTLTLLKDAFDMEEDPGAGVEEAIPTREVRRVYRSSSISNLKVIDKKNGGKSDALNCGINAASSAYMLCVDADTLMTEHTIKYLIMPFLRDKRVVVTSGSVRILSPPRTLSIFANLQKIEFVNSISLFRSGWNFLNANLIVSGALGLFKREVIVQVGGYHNMAIGEDMEIVLRIHRYLTEQKIPYRIIQLAMPTCFTTALPDIRSISKQRKRWQKGLLSSVRLNLGMFLNYRYKWVGMAGMPFYVIFEIFSPIAEVFGFSFFFFVMFYPDVTKTPLLIWIAGLFLAIVNNWMSISIDKFLLRGMGWKEYGKLLLSSLTDPFIYHFFQIYFKIKATIEYFFEVQVSTVWDTERKN